MEKLANAESRASASSSSYSIETILDWLEKERIAARKSMAAFVEALGKKENE